MSSKPPGGTPTLVSMPCPEPPPPGPPSASDVERQAHIARLTIELEARDRYIMRLLARNHQLRVYAHQLEAELEASLSRTGR